MFCFSSSLVFRANLSCISLNLNISFSSFEKFYLSLVEVYCEKFQYLYSIDSIHHCSVKAQLHFRVYEDTTSFIRHNW